MRARGRRPRVIVYVLGLPVLLFVPRRLTATKDGEAIDSVAVDAARASYYIDNTHQCFGDGIAGCEVTDLVRAGSQPAGDGRWGHAELAGNVSEWVLDDYMNPYPTTTCDDCAYLGTPVGPVNRGGDFKLLGQHLRTVERTLSSPQVNAETIGFRCARAA